MPNWVSYNKFTKLNDTWTYKGVYFWPYFSWPPLNYTVNNDIIIRRGHDCIEVHLILSCCTNVKKSLTSGSTRTSPSAARITLILLSLEQKQMTFVDLVQVAVGNLMNFVLCAQYLCVCVCLGGEIVNNCIVYSSWVVLWQSGCTDTPFGFNESLIHFLPPVKTFKI